MPFLAPALISLVWLVVRHDAYERSISLTLSSNSSASPGLRLPGLLHFREGSTPLAVVAIQPPPVRRMLPWNTCGDTQGLVRTSVQPSSIDCNFMSRLTIQLTDGGPSVTPELPECVAGPPFGAAPWFGAVKSAKIIAFESVPAKELPTK